MKWIICPRCDLNFIQEGEKMCSVCRKEVRGEVENEEILEMCSECGERPVVPGGELCAYCLKEMSHGNDDEHEEGTLPAQEPNVGGMDAVSSMEEIQLDIPDSEFDEEADPFDDDDDDDNEDDV